LQEDTLILKAQLKKLEAQTDVAQREELLGRMGHSTSYDELTVAATQGLGNTMMATLNASDGSDFDVRPGDTLPNGMRVVSIRPGVVVLDNHGRRTTLTVSSPRSRESRMAAGNGMSTGMSGGVPPIPTLPMPVR
jgi:type IV pilus biogenesis protein PilP